MLKNHTLISSNRVRFSAGFTLAELLIALAILGVIAAFTIPKILTAQADQQKKAVFRETYAAMSQILNSARVEGIDQGDMGDYFLTHLNYIKLCPTDSSVEGCWDTGVQGTHSNYSDLPGVVLANGAQITGSGFTAFDGYLSPGVYCRAFMIDWNGIKPPNTLGDDMDGIMMNTGSAIDSDSMSWCYNIRPGTLTSWNGIEDSIFAP